jgi:epoxyqueuosine reductase QueG
MASAPEGNVNPALADLHSPEVTARHVKELAAYLGADLVGITRVDPDEQYGEQRPFAIVCGVRAPYDPGRAAGVGGQAPAMDTQYASFVVAAYIRELGYQATAAPDARAAALAARAGLGQLSPEGRLVTPAWGESVHVAEVIRTDLPLQADG